MYKKTSPIVEVELKSPSPQSWDRNERVEDEYTRPKNFEKAGSATDLKDKETVGSLLREFAQITSAHGLGRIEAAVNLFRRLLWIAIVLAAFVVLCYMCYGVIDQFLSKPVATSVKVSFQKNMEFPSVTVCNMNMLRISKIENETALKDLTKMISGYDNSWFPQNSNGGGTNQTGSNNHTVNAPSPPAGRKRRATESDEDEDIDEDSMRGWVGTGGDETDDFSDVEYNSDDMMTKKIDKMITKMPVSKIKKAGHPFSDLIFKCSWLGFNCKKGSFRKYWTNFWNWKYGNCYVFNTGFSENGTRLPVFTTASPGPDNGLSMDLFIDQDEYVGLMSPEAGVRIVLSEQGTMPFPYDQGFSISPGTSSSIGIRKVIIGRADPFNNRTCHDDGNEKNREFMDLFLEYYKGTKNYSVNACTKNCLAKAQMNICNCSETRFPRAQGKANQACRTKKQELCLIDVQKKYEQDVYNCTNECPQKCTNSVFRHTISQSQWSKAYEDLMKRKLSAETDQRFSKAGGDSSELQKNFLRVNIFYEELNYEQIEQYEYYFIENMLGDIGGQLGLWVGISVITVAEIFELVMNLFLLLCKRMMIRKK